jgi:hypothetical protein
MDLILMGTMVILPWVVAQVIWFKSHDPLAGSVIYLLGGAVMMLILGPFSGPAAPPLSAGIILILALQLVFLFFVPAYVYFWLVRRYAEYVFAHAIRILGFMAVPAAYFGFPYLVFFFTK